MYSSNWEFTETITLKTAMTLTIHPKCGNSTANAQS